MRGLGGIVLLAGIGVGLFVYFPAPVDRDTSLEEAKRTIASRAAEQAMQPRLAPVEAVARPSSRLASFSPGPSLTLAHARGRVASIAQPAAVPPAARVETVANWQTSVAPASGSLDPQDPDARYRLVVDIQQELKRVGCYWGRASGAWNNSTREAMREFTTHANAALPVDKPDYLLLTLLKSHNGRSCGAPDTTTAAAAPAEVLPWKPARNNNAQAAQPQRLFTPVPMSTVSTEPLPGRMSIGGPKDLAPATQEPLIPGASGQAQVASVEPTEPVRHSAPAVAPRPRPSKKTASARRSGPGTPRYNLMLSLGGVY